MHFLLNLVQWVFALAAIIPFATFFILYFVLNRFMEDKKKAKTLTIDITTLLLVFVVSAMFNTIIRPGMSFLWIILFAFLVAFGLAGGMQTRSQGKVDLQRTFRIIWRIGFLVLSLLYIILLLIGIGQYFFRV